MFVRFTKRGGDPNRVYRRAVAINGTYLIQNGDEIVAYARCENKNALKDNADKYPIYKIWVSSGDEELVRYVKRFIGNSAKWENENYKRRMYKVVVTSGPICSKAFTIDIDF